MIEKHFFYKWGYISIYVGKFFGFGFNIMQGKITILIPFFHIWICKAIPPKSF